MQSSTELKLRVPHIKTAHVSGDSAYGFEEFIRTMQKHQASFTIAARKNIPWENAIPELEDLWTQHKYTVDELLRLQKKKKEPPPRFYTRWHLSYTVQREPLNPKIGD